ncbi:hypothetical protein MMC31_007794 [Peltigera leucophlebia]|nr:hypothetical protein [Peltigera leucophlebia]
MRKTSFSDLSTAHDEQGILKSREYLHSLIKAEIDKGIPSSRIILGGFSQGGAMSLFAGVTCPDSLAGIFGLSSYLLLHHRIKDFTCNPNKDTPIFMGHGSADELVKFEWGRQTAQALRDLGHQVDFRSYPGLKHSADMDEINDLEGWLQERLSPVEPQDG